MRRWTVLNTTQQLYRQFRQTSRSIPKPAWHRWRQTLLIGFSIDAAFTLMVTLLTKSMQSQGLQAWDTQVLPIATKVLPLTFARSITWESPGNSVCMLAVVITFTVAMIRRSQPLLAASMIAAYGLQFALVWIGWLVWNRPRPDLIADGIAAPALHSFPSGHAALVFTVYGFMTWLWVRSSRSISEKILAILLFILGAGLVSTARLELGAHWVSDIIAGFLIGAVWLPVIIVAVRRAEAVIRDRLIE